MGQGSGTEIGSKARSDSQESMLVRHFKRLLSQLLVEATSSHVLQCIQPDCFGCVWVGLIPDSKPPAMSLGCEQCSSGC